MVATVGGERVEATVLKRNGKRARVEFTQRSGTTTTTWVECAGVEVVTQTLREDIKLDAPFLGVKIVAISAQSAAGTPATDQPPLPAAQMFDELTDIAKPDIAKPNVVQAGGLWLSAGLSWHREHFKLTSAPVATDSGPVAKGIEIGTVVCIKKTGAQRGNLATVTKAFSRNGELEIEVKMLNGNHHGRTKGYRTGELEQVKEQNDFEADGKAQLEIVEPGLFSSRATPHRFRVCYGGTRLLLAAYSEDDRSAWLDALSRTLGTANPDCKIAQNSAQIAKYLTDHTVEPRQQHRTRLQRQSTSTIQDASADATGDGGDGDSDRDRGGSADITTADDFKAFQAQNDAFQLKQQSEKSASADGRVTGSDTASKQAAFSIALRCNACHMKFVPARSHGRSTSTSQDASADATGDSGDGDGDRDREWIDIPEGFGLLEFQALLTHKHGRKWKLFAVAFAPNDPASFWIANDKGKISQWVYDFHESGKFTVQLPNEKEIRSDDIGKYVVGTKLRHGPNEGWTVRSVHADQGSSGPGAVIIEHGEFDKHVCQECKAGKLPHDTRTMKRTTDHISECGLCRENQLCKFVSGSMFDSKHDYAGTTKRLDCITFVPGTGQGGQDLIMCTTAPDRKLRFHVMQRQEGVWVCTKPSAFVVDTDHKNWVHSISFAPDGNSCITVSGHEGENMHIFSGPFACTENPVGRPEKMCGSDRVGSKVMGVTHSPCGQYVVTVSMDTSACVFYCSDGALKMLCTFDTGHSETIYDIQFHPNATQFATVAGDKTLRFWDFGSGTKSPALISEIQTPHTGRLRGLAYSPNGKHLITAADDGTVCMLAIEDIDLFQDLDVKLPATEGNLYGCAFKGKGTEFFTASRNPAKVKLWGEHLNLQPIAGGQQKNELEICRWTDVRFSNEELFKDKFSHRCSGWKIGKNRTTPRQAFDEFLGIQNLEEDSELGVKDTSKLLWYLGVTPHSGRKFEEFVQAVVDEADHDKNGSIDFKEFETYIVPMLVDDDRLKEAGLSVLKEDSKPNLKRQATAVKIKGQNEAAGEMFVVRGIAYLSDMGGFVLISENYYQEAQIWAWDEKKGAYAEYQSLNLKHSENVVGVSSSLSGSTFVTVSHDKEAHLFRFKDSEKQYGDAFCAKRIDCVKLLDVVDVSHCKSDVDDWWCTALKNGALHIFNGVGQYLHTVVLDFPVLSVVFVCINEFRRPVLAVLDEKMSIVTVCSTSTSANKHRVISKVSSGLPTELKYCSSMKYSPDGGKLAVYGASRFRLFNISASCFRWGDREVLKGMAGPKQHDTSTILVHHVVTAYQTGNAEGVGAYLDYVTGEEDTRYQQARWIDCCHVALKLAMGMRTVRGFEGSSIPNLVLVKSIIESILTYSDASAHKHRQLQQACAQALHVDILRVLLSEFPSYALALLESNRLKLVSVEGSEVIPDWRYVFDLGPGEFIVEAADTWDPIGVWKAQARRKETKLSRILARNERGTVQYKNKYD